MKTNNQTDIVTIFCDDMIENGASRVFTEGSMMCLSDNIFDPTWHMHDRFLEGTGKNILIKFHDDWIAKVSLRVYTRLFYELTFELIFHPTWPVDKVITTKIRRFHDDWMKEFGLLSVTRLILLLIIIINYYCDLFFYQVWPIYNMTLEVIKTKPLTIGWIMWPLHCLKKCGRTTDDGHRTITIALLWASRSQVSFNKKTYFFGSTRACDSQH